jgi:hypothetical protein
MTIPGLIALLIRNGNSKESEAELDGFHEHTVPAFVTELQALEPPLRVVALEISMRRGKSQL